MRMDKRMLGDTTLQVTPLGLGLAALGRPGYINLGHAEDLGRNYDEQAMESHAHWVLDEAWESGIRYYDAARSYGRAEQFLSSWLKSRHISPEDVSVGSKWGYTYTAGWQVMAEKHEVKEHSLTVLKRQFRESRALLGDYLDLYQIHSATMGSGVLQNAAVLAELARLRDAGLQIGLSLSGPDQSETLRKALEIRFDGCPLFSAVQATWNLLETSAGEVLREAGAAGLGVVVKEALANGRLTSSNLEPSFQAKRALLERLAQELGATIDAVALGAALAQPWVDVVLSGAATVEHLRSNAAALSLEWSEEMAAQLGPLIETPESYWKTRSQLAWN
jgi:aryl-alcohol dehydrogenase-like predicted oxidoreductase